jgi:hypothetical protein
VCCLRQVSKGPSDPFAAVTASRALHDEQLQAAQNIFAAQDPFKQGFNPGKHTWADVVLLCVWACVRRMAYYSRQY